MNCPICNGECKIITETNSYGKDFSLGKALCGTLILGYLGILCGLCGKGRQIETTTYWICEKCGNKFKA